ncbi:MAG: HEAT repeat domain-containing protein [Candidatus Bipolaricaulia bacterium]
MKGTALSLVLLALIGLAGCTPVSVDERAASVPPTQDMSGLIEALRGEDEDESLQAALELAEIGPAAVPPLVEALRDEDEGVRWNASFALGVIGSAAVPPLTEALQDEDSDMRVIVAYSLAGIGPDAREAIPVLTEALRDEDSDVRKAAAYALETIKGEGQDESLESESTLEPAETESDPELTTYQVQPGDSLWTVAEKVYGNGFKWTVIAEANGIDVENPRGLRVGEWLIIPELQE